MLSPLRGCWGTDRVARFQFRIFGNYQVCTGRRTIPPAGRITAFEGLGEPTLME